MTDSDKLRSIRELVTTWLDHPDPIAGRGNSPEASDVLCQIESVLDEEGDRAPPKEERARSLLEMLRREGLQPARTTHHLNGTTSATWHVDDDNDRFVKLSSSVGSEDYLLVVRDHLVSDAVVLREPANIIEWVRSRLDEMSARRPGRRA